MLFKNILTLASTAAIASAENVYLTVKSDNSEINGNSLGYPHEGAGINYFFLGSGSPSALNYDVDSKTIIYPFTAQYNEYFGISGNFVGLTVASPNGEVTFQDNTLAFNGSTENFYACKNTGDPYDYSSSSYGLMYYTSGAPDGCLSLTIVNSTVSDTSSSTLSTSATSLTATYSLAANVSSAYEGSGFQNSPAGVFAILAGAAVALI